MATLEHALHVMSCAMSIQRIRRSFSAFLMASVVAWGSTALAGEIRTYEFIDDEVGRLRFGGGLISGDSFGRPVGSFDVTIDDNGTATLTRFDIAVAEIEVTVEGAAPLINGSNLANYLFGVNPVGLEAQYNSAVVFASHPIALEPIDFSTNADPSFRMILSSILDESISVSFHALSGYPLDNPSLRTTESGLRARLVTVPEPASVLIFVASSLLLRCLRRTVAP